MSITAVSADGVSHVFPDGTNSAVIGKVMKDYALSHQPKSPSLAPLTPTPKPSPQNPIGGPGASVGAGLVSGLGSAVLGTAQLAGQALTPSPSEPAPLQFISKTLSDIGRAQGISGPTLTAGSQRGLDWLSGQTQPYEQEHPELYGAGNIAGQMAAAMGPEGAMGDISAARGLIGRMGQAIRGGLTAGEEQPVSGPDYWSGKERETAENVEGAVATGGVLEGANFAKSGVGRYMMKNKPEALRSQAVQAVARTLAADEKGGGPTAEHIIDMFHKSHAAGVPSTLMEIGGENLKGLAGRLHRSQGASRTIITQSFLNRLRNSASRLTASVRSNFNSPNTRREVGEALSESQRTSSKPLYEKAFEPGSMKPIQEQFTSEFNRISKERKDAGKALNSAYQNLNQTAARMINVGRDIKTNKLARQQMNQAQRLVDEAEARVQSVEDDHADILKQLKTAQTAESQGKGAAVYSPYIARLLKKNPDIQKGIAHGLKIQRNEAHADNVRFDPTDYAVELDAEGNPKLIKTPNMRLLDAAKKGLDNMLEEYRDPVTGRLNLDEYGRSIEKLRVSLVNELDRINPNYKIARAAWAGPAASKGAMKQGEAILRTHPEDVKDIFSKMTPSQQEHFRIGAAQAYLDKLGPKGSTASEIRDISKDEDEAWARQRIKPIFKTKKQFENFIDSASGERAIRDAYHHVVGNSATARRVVEDATHNIAPYLDVAQGIAHTAHGDLLSGGMAFLRAKRNLGLIQNQALNEEVAKILTDPELLSKAEPGQVLPMFQPPAPSTPFLPSTPIVPIGDDQQTQ